MAILLACPAIWPSCGGSSGTISSDPWTVLLGTPGDDVGYGVTTDAAGNILITGETSGSLDGAPFSGSTDLFLAKFGPSGEKSWIRQRGGPARGIAVAVDGTGNVFVAGEASSSFDNNVYVGGVDVVLVKYDDAGTLVWSSQFGTTGSDVPNAIAVDGNGNIFVAGSTSGDLGGSGNAGLDDTFLAKVDPANGTLVWVEQIGTPFFEVGEGVATDNTGRIFLCGMTHNGDVEGTGSPPGGEDFFVASFLDNGSSAIGEWVRQYGTAENEYPVAIGVSDNTLFVAGYADGDIDGNSNQGSWDIFLWRISAADGTSVGATMLGSTETDFAESLAMATDGSVFIAGRTRGDLGAPNQDPASSTFDIFLAKFDNARTLLWIRQAGTPEDDWGLSASADGSGSAYVGGKSMGDLDGRSNAGGWDAFLLKYDGDGERR